MADPRSTADLTEQLLDWVGAAEPGENLNATLRRNGTVEAAALSILRRRRATLGPDSWSLSGDYSESDGGRRARWLDQQIATLEERTGDVRAQMTGTVTRSQPIR